MLNKGLLFRFQNHRAVIGRAPYRHKVLANKDKGIEKTLVMTDHKTIFQAVLVIMSILIMDFLLGFRIIERLLNERSLI